MRVGILANADKKGSLDVVAGLLSWLPEHGHQVILPGELATRLKGRKKGSPPGEFRRRSQLVVAIGGDGTILHAARILAPHDVPVLGVNLGTLGFLAEVVPKHLYRAMERIFTGKHTIEERMLLKARIGDSGPWHYALNDMVIDKGGISRVIELHVWIDDHFVGSYKADGVIISTPTGSTAYSLSAGGPIMNPKMRAIVATPICPHSLAVRPLVIDHDEVLRIEVISDHQKMTFNVDGQESHRLRSGDVMTAAAAEPTLKLVRVGSRSFYEILRSKLKWGIKPATEEDEKDD
jgi:NAD+ kinase